VKANFGPFRVTRESRAHGDVHHTAADTRVAASAFGYLPRTGLAEGLRAMMAWERGRDRAVVT
jgi:nucleoside-diphosphate-sugar epimerase